METFNLLESGVIVEGALVTELNPVECEEAQEYNCTEGTDPTWTYEGKVIESTLEIPMVYAEFNEARTMIRVQSTIWIKESTIETLKIAVFVTDKADTFYIVAGHSDRNATPGEEDETYDIDFEVAVSEHLQGKTKLELYSFREDPKTSRGTVTTVQHQPMDI